MAISIHNLRILIVAGDTLARVGLAALLANQPALQVVGQVAPEGDLAVQIGAYQPDIVLWDLGWSPIAQLDKLAEFVDAGKPVLALVPDDGYTSQVWATGVRGLLLREAGADALAAALAGLAQGLVVLEATLATGVAISALNAPSPPTEALTPRELEVLRRMAEGLSNKLIARELEISEHTVKFHVNAILGKLGAQSRTEAVVRASRGRA